MKVYEFSNGMIVILGITLSQIDIWQNDLIVGKTEYGNIQFSKIYPNANVQFNCIVKDKSVIVWQYIE
jgi:hypothetical protein